MKHRQRLQNKPPLRRFQSSFTRFMGLLLFGLMGCGYEGASTPVIAPLHWQDSKSALTLQVVVGKERFSQNNHHYRRAQFISADTAGVAIAFSGSSSANFVLNVAPGAAACGGSFASPRTCQMAIAIPPGTYTLVTNSYDAAPVANAIPGTANKLATNTLTSVSILAGHANMTTVYLNGIIASYTTPPSYVSLPADGAAHQVGFSLAPKDIDSETITAGVNDPYANPITLTITESGGTGHTSFIVNSVNVGASALVTKSTDNVQLTYDGFGSAGYSASIAVTASSVVTTTLTVSPLYVTPSTDNYGLAAIHFNAKNQVTTLAITERYAPGATSYTASVTGCSNIATLGTLSGSGVSASAALAVGTLASASGCTFTVTDSLGTAVTVPVTNSLYAPTGIATAALWLDGNDATTITSSGGFVSAWNDKSGVGNNTTQITSSSRPSIVAAAINGLPALHFGYGRTLATSNTTLNVNNSKSYSIFCVVLNQDISQYSSLIGTPNAASPGQLTFATNAYGSTGMFLFSGNSTTNTSLIFSVAPLSSSPQLVEGLAGANSYVESFTNGGAAYGYAMSTDFNPYTQIIVGGGWYGSQYPGDIAEVLIYSSFISLANIRKVEGYLAWKWGLQAQLPANHTYAAAPP